MDCKFKYSVERFNSKEDKWEIEYRFYYIFLPENHSDFKNTSLFRNMKFIEKIQ